MSDFDTEPNVGQDGEGSIEALQKKIAALEKDNAKYREERRVAADAAFLDKYGEDIVAKVKDLPDEHRERMAQTLLDLRPAAPEQNEQAPEETPNVEVPAGLAAVTNAPATGAPEAQTLTPDEFKQHVDAEGLTVAAQKYGHMVRFPDIDNPLATGQAAQVQGTYKPPS